MSPAESLERRYRRLLALYPSAHRREYEEEMIGVLLADSPPDRRRPGPAEVLDLVRSAVTTHLSARAVQLRDGPWRQALQTVQLFGAILLLAVALRRVLMGQVVVWHHLGYLRGLPLEAAVRPALWALVVALAAIGLRRTGLRGAGPRRAGRIGLRWLAVPVALAGVVAEVLPSAGLYRDTPALFLNVYWIIVTAVVVTVASALTAAAGPVRRAGDSTADRPDDRLPRGTWLVAFGGVLVAGSEVIGMDDPSTGFFAGGRSLSAWGVASYAAAAVAVVLGVLHLPAAVGRRLAVIAVPVLVTAPLVEIGLGGFIEHNMRSGQPAVLLNPVQWASLVLVPLAAMAVAAWLNHRFEGSSRRFAGTA